MQIQLAQRAETIRVAARGLTEFAEDRATIATMRAIEEAIIAQANQAEAAQTGEGDAIAIDLEPGQWRVAKDALLLAGRFPRLALTISAALENSQARAVGPDASQTQAGENATTADDEKTIDPASGKEIVHDVPKDGQLIGTITAIGNSEDLSVIVEDDDKKTWVSIRKRDLKILLATLGPDPLDGRRQVLIRTDKLGDVQDITVYAGAVV